MFSHRKKIDLPPLKFGYELNTRMDDIKMLGLYIDEHLNFNQHVSTTCMKNSKLVGVLYKLSSFLPVDIMIHPYLRTIT